MAWLRRLTLLVIAGLAGLSYAWALGRDSLEVYYAAAVRSMSMSWHDFIFGTFDPAGTITLDKLPGAFWVQALAVRVFGFHTWAIVAPQAIEGVLTVLVLYRAVARLAGPVAGLVAAGVLAVSPAVVALDRGNISDSLMILLLVLAADAVSAAIVIRRDQDDPEPAGTPAPDRLGPAWLRAFGHWLGRTTQGRLVVAAIWVGLAFQAKMVEAWLVLPAFGLAYLLSGPGRARRRWRELAVAGVVTGVVSLSWMAAVSLVPAANRPYVDGSHDDSVFVQVFSYNGFSRLGDHTPQQVASAQLGGISGPAAYQIPDPSPDRLLVRGLLSRDIGWLVPASAVVLAWGLVGRGRRSRRDPVRACLVLWGGWLAAMAAAFSANTVINTYYTAALAPALAAILAAGVGAAWPPRRAAAGRRIGLVIGVAIVVAGTAGYALWLLPASGTGLPGWLVPAVIAVSAAAVIVLAGSVVVRRDRLFAAGLAAALTAMVLVPAVASVGLTVRHQSAFDTPFEPVSLADVLGSGPARLADLETKVVPRLESSRFMAPYLLVTQTSAVAAGFIAASGKEALPIGGVTGTIPAPTLSQLRNDMLDGKFHVLLALTTRDPRVGWLASHCSRLSPASVYYYCVPADDGP
jgi:4-amino-4-deoxy-L-arabinose transferase-like glycosyltransferase